MTITNPAAVRRLVVGCWSKIDNVMRYGAAGPEAAAYVEAAHIGLGALGCSVPATSDDLYVLIKNAVQDAGPVYDRVALTDDIVAALGG